MAEREIERWITVNGVHVPIYKGQSADEAIKERQIARNKAEADKLNSVKPRKKPVSLVKVKKSDLNTINKLREQYTKAHTKEAQNQIQQAVREWAEKMPDGTAIASVRETSSITHTSKGMVSNKDLEISALYKIKGYWATYRDGSGKEDDIALAVLYSGGRQFMSLKDAEALKEQYASERKTRSYGSNSRWE